MILCSRILNSARTKVVIGTYFENGDVLAMYGDKHVGRIPRYMIETPVVCCAKCGKPAMLKVHPHTKKDYAECPDHARHMYEALYTASHDVRQYNRKQRRDLHKQAGKWLVKWRQDFETRQSEDAQDVQMDHSSFNS